MRNSRFVECGPSETVFDSPTSEYTRLLLDTAPRLDPHTRSITQP
ncbi:ABC transporter ATP-binding protein [Granulosicoccus sp. 3-233]